MIKRRGQTGFTIVELLIVIVVIAILAAIVIVAYNNIQMRARDTARRDTVTKFEKAISLWSINTGRRPRDAGFGAGSTANDNAGNCSGGSANGFVSTGYVCTFADILEDTGLLKAGFFSGTPKNTAYGNTGLYAMMFYTCTPMSASHYVIYYHLESPTADDTAEINQYISTCSNPAAIRDSWGMRAARLYIAPN